MSTTTIGYSEPHMSVRASSISRLFHTNKKELQGTALRRRYVRNRSAETRRGEWLRFDSRGSANLNQDEVKSASVLDAWCMFVYMCRLLGRYSRTGHLRSTRNALAPINKIPPEVLTLIPNFWEMYERNRDIVALMHVCRAWRQTFISRSLWTDFDCVDAAKTLVYLERSKSSPINLWLDRERPLLPHDSTFQITPHAIARLNSVGVVGPVENIQDITAHLSHPAPLLEDMTINGYHTALSSRSYPTLTPTLFNEDLCSLGKLFIQGVYSTLPWRNMVNLTSFTPGHTTEEGEISIGQLLDFLESAPGLLERSQA